MSIGRQIFFEMGFTEMPTSLYVESGFWVCDLWFLIPVPGCLEICAAEPHTIHSFDGVNCHLPDFTNLKLQSELRCTLRTSGSTPKNIFLRVLFSNLLKQHPARDLQDTFYVSDPKVAGRPGPESADDKRDYDEYFENVRQVHENGKFGSIGYRYPWSEEESLRFVKKIGSGELSNIR